MPELPEVEVVRRGLESHVVGRRFAGVEVLHDRPVRRHLAGADDFTAQVRVADRLHGHGVGRSKKEAEQQAAESAYRTLADELPAAAGADASGA